MALAKKLVTDNTYSDYRDEHLFFLTVKIWSWKEDFPRICSVFLTVPFQFQIILQIDLDPVFPTAVEITRPVIPLPLCLLCQHRLVSSFAREPSETDLAILYHNDLLALGHELSLLIFHTPPTAGQARVS